MAVQLWRMNDSVVRINMTMYIVIKFLLHYTNNNFYTWNFQPQNTSIVLHL